MSLTQSSDNPTGDRKLEMTDFEKIRRLADNAARRLEYKSQMKHEAFVSGSEEALYCLDDPAKAPPGHSAPCLFAWTGTTAEDLRFWDLQHEYGDRSLDALSPELKNADRSTEEWRKRQNRYICDAMGIPLTADLPVNRFTTLGDISAIFASQPTCGPGVPQGKGVAIYDPDRANVWRVPNTNVFLAYLNYSRSPRVLARFALCVRNQDYVLTGKLDYHCPPGDTRTMEEIVEDGNKGIGWQGCVIFTIANTSPEWSSKWFPNAPWGAHAAVIGRRTLVDQRLRLCEEDKQFYSLTTQRDTARELGANTSSNLVEAPASTTTGPTEMVIR